MIDIVSRRLWFFLLSALLIIICAVSLGVFGLKTGIDFASGSELTVQFNQPVSLKSTDIEKELAKLGYTANVEVDSEANYHIRTIQLNPQEKAKVKETLVTKFGELTEKSFESVDPLIARETTRAAVIAVAVASIGILLYMAFAFRKVPKPFHYGICAVIALVHDVLIVLGVFSILGRLAGWEIDLALTTGILTVIGYAVNDTIVVFDRIRENQKRYVGTDFGLVINTSLTATMSRSLVTGMGVFFVLVALILFVGPAIKNLAVVLMVGILTGTYTSVFIAAPMLYVWDKGDWGSLTVKREMVKKPA
ncbi:MAG: protein translocase subunit SecF [Dehalococcoidia bacterium]|nr:protein translocase subunit SecF [Dehalococcoidia bacterium]